MSRPDTATAGIWTAGVRQTLRWQILLGCAVAIATTMLMGMAFGLGVAYGVALAVINGYWLAKRISRAASLDQVAGQRVLYVAAAARFLALLAALAAAQLLGLHLLAVAAGLLLAHAVAFTYAAAHRSQE